MKVLCEYTHARVYLQFCERDTCTGFEKEITINLVPLDFIKHIPLGQGTVSFLAFMFMSSLYRDILNLSQQEEDNDPVDVSLEG